MLLVETTITELAEYINLWNNEYALRMVFRGQHGKHTAWTMGNVLITGIEIAPGRVLCEFDNFDLQGANDVARRVTRRLVELLHESFDVNDTLNASRVYGIMARQAIRMLRIIPAILADTLLDAETEADFKARAREKNPDITEEERLFLTRLSWGPMYILTTNRMQGTAQAGYSDICPLGQISLQIWA